MIVIVRHMSSTGDCANIVSLFCCTILNGGKREKKLEEKVRNDEEHQELEQLLRAVGVKKEWKNSRENIKLSEK